VIKGRTFNAQDLSSSQAVAVVDDEFVHRFWPTGDPIGKRITFQNLTDSSIRWIQVVGVVAHTKHEALDANARIQLYLPYMQNAGPIVTVGVRTTVAPAQLSGALRAAVQSYDKSNRSRGSARWTRCCQPQRDSAVINAAHWRLCHSRAHARVHRHLRRDVVLRHAAHQRTGYRMALGAARTNVLGLVVWQGMELALIGVLWACSAASGSRD